MARRPVSDGSPLPMFRQWSATTAVELRAEKVSTKIGYLEADYPPSDLRLQGLSSYKYQARKWDHHHPTFEKLVFSKKKKMRHFSLALLALFILLCSHSAIAPPSLSHECLVKSIRIIARVAKVPTTDVLDPDQMPVSTRPETVYAIVIGHTNHQPNEPCSFAVHPIVPASWPCTHNDVVIDAEPFFLPPDGDPYAILQLTKHVRTSSITEDLEHSIHDIHPHKILENLNEAFEKALHERDRMREGMFDRSLYCLQSLRPLTN